MALKFSLKSRFLDLRTPDLTRWLRQNAVFAELCETDFGKKKRALVSSGVPWRNELSFVLFPRGFVMRCIAYP